MSTRSGEGRLLFGIIGVALLGVVALAALSGGAARAASNCTYYSNAAHTTIVGQFGYDCCNNPVAWGMKTKYSSCGGCFPCTPPPR